MITQMIIVLVIIIVITGMIISDKFAFWEPPFLACALMVIAGACTIKNAFAWLVDTNGIMIAVFMTAMAGLQKTRLMGKTKGVMGSLAEKGGFTAYALLILVAMLGASLLSGTTGYYVMIITIIFRLLDLLLVL